MSGRIDFSYGESSDPVPRLGDAEPYRVLVLGDFSCRAGRGALDPGQLSERRVHAVDPDTLDTVLRHLGASAAVPESPESGDRLSLHGLDDLHPDGLLARVPVLADLLDLHRRLGRPDAAAEAVDEVRRRFGPVAATAAPAEPPASPETEPDDETLRRILGGKGPSSGGDRDHPPASLDRLLRTAVEGDVSPAPEAAQEVGQEIVARALTSRLLEILALPEIRRLEAAWRSLDRLTRSVESGGQLQIHLLDVAREEIEADLATAADSVSQTELFRRLAHHGPGGPDRPGWSVVVLDLAFGPAEPDVRLVGSLGRLSGQRVAQCRNRQL